MKTSLGCTTTIPGKELYFGIRNIRTIYLTMNTTRTKAVPMMESAVGTYIQAVSTLSERGQGSREAVRPGSEVMKHKNNRGLTCSMSCIASWSIGRTADGGWPYDAGLQITNKTTNVLFTPPDSAPFANSSNNTALSASPTLHIHFQRFLGFAMTDQGATIVQKANPCPALLSICTNPADNPRCPESLFAQ